MQCCNSGVLIGHAYMGDYAIMVGFIYLVFYSAQYKFVVRGKQHGRNMS